MKKIKKNKMIYAMSKVFKDGSRFTEVIYPTLEKIKELFPDWETQYKSIDKYTIGFLIYCLDLNNIKEYAKWSPNPYEFYIFKAENGRYYKYDKNQYNLTDFPAPKKYYEKLEVKNLKYFNKEISQKPDELKKIIPTTSNQFERSNNISPIIKSESKDLYIDRVIKKVDFLVNETELEIEILKLNVLELLKSFNTDEIIDNQPGVYCFFDKKEIYIGESAIPLNRLKQHYYSKKKLLKNHHQMIVFRSEKFNKSVIYDIETNLIEFMITTKNKLNLLNSQKSQGSHNYFLKEEYEKLIEIIWNYLRGEGISNYDINDLYNQDIFKFSPYKSLNSGQLNVLQEVQNDFKTEMTLVKGYPGTGKSIVASTLYERLSQEKSVALVAGTKPIHASFSKVFKYHKKTCKTHSRVLRPKDVINNNHIYDVIVVDEAHRLAKISSQAYQSSFKHLRNNNYNNDLEGLMEKCKKIILFYDENQIVHDKDFYFNENNYNISKTLFLKEQMRAVAGYKFISYIIHSISGENEKYIQSDDYDYKIFTSFKDMYYALKKKSENNQLVRLVSGYSRDWKSKHNPKDFDIEIDGIQLIWPVEGNQNKWYHSDAAKELKEVGFYDSVQGFDLTYCGVIIGRDIYLDDNGEIQINENFIPVRNHKPNKKDPNYYQKLRIWIINRYKVLLSRGSKGTYIYVEDEKLRDKLLEELIR